MNAKEEQKVNSIINSTNSNWFDDCHNPVFDPNNNENPTQAVFFIGTLIRIGNALAKVGKLKLKVSCENTKTTTTNKDGSKIEKEGTKYTGSLG